MPAFKASISSYILIRIELTTHICLLTCGPRFENALCEIPSGVLSATSRA